MPRGARFRRASPPSIWRGELEVHRLTEAEGAAQSPGCFRRPSAERASLLKPMPLGGPGRAGLGSFSMAKLYGPAAWIALVLFALLGVLHVAALLRFIAPSIGWTFAALPILMFCQVRAAQGARACLGGHG